MDFSVVPRYRDRIGVTPQVAGPVLSIAPRVLSSTCIGLGNSEDDCMSLSSDEFADFFYSFGAGRQTEGLKVRTIGCD